MTPEYKFHMYIAGFTVSIMYIIITKGIPLLNGLEFGSEYIKPIVTFVSAVAIYDTLYKVLIVLSRNLNWLNKHLLGARYLNGTWIGKFTIENNEPIFSVEIFEQTISSLKIRGYAFHENGKTFAQWVSTSESINEIDGVLTYTYGCNRNQDISSFDGIGVFNFERAGTHVPPTHISGYSADLIDGVRNQNREKKVSDKLLLIDEALKLAKKEYRV